MRYFFEFNLGQQRLEDSHGEEFASRTDALKYGRLLAGEMARSDVANLRDACVVVLNDRRDELGRIFLLDVLQVGAAWNGSARSLH